MHVPFTSECSKALDQFLPTLLAEHIAVVSPPEE
jgi:hypothetical protein